MLSFCFPLFHFLDTLYFGQREGGRKKEDNMDIAPDRHCTARMYSVILSLIIRRGCAAFQRVSDLGLCLKICTTPFYVIIVIYVKKLFNLCTFCPNEVLIAIALNRIQEGKHTVIIRLLDDDPMSSLRDIQGSVLGCRDHIPNFHLMFYVFCTFPSIS